MINRSPVLRLIANLHRDRRGQMAILFVLTLLVVFILFALAFDAGLWYFDHRTAQNQADAAALAAVQDLPADADHLGPATDHAKQWLTRNGAADDLADCPLPSNGCPYRVDDRIVYWYCSGDGKFDTVRVCVGRDSPGIFAALSGIDAVRVSAAATAKVIKEPSTYALMSMNEHDCKSFLVQGNVDVTVTEGGGSYTRSDCADNALQVGGSATLTTGVNDVVGGADIVGGADMEPPATPQDYLDDPYGDLDQPTVSGACFDGEYKYTTGTAELWPGRYCDTLEVNGAVVTFNPGVYVLEHGLKVTGGTFTSDADGDGVLDDDEGVLLYNTCPTSPCNGSQPDDIEKGGNAIIKVKGLPEYDNIVIWVDRTAGDGSQVKLVGGADDYLAGRIYAITAKVDISGSPGVVLTLNMSIVADTIELHGDATIDIPFDPLLAPPIWRMALIE